MIQLEFLKAFERGVKTGTALTLIGFSTTVGAFEAGTHYDVLQHEDTSDPAVTLFHSPYCAPCAIVHDPLHRIAKDAGAEFIEVPVDFGSLSKEIQRGFVVAERQGKEHEYVQSLISLIHHKRNSAPQNASDIKKILEGCEVDTSDLYDESCTYIDDSVGAMNALAVEYEINQTPTILVNGNKRVNLSSLRSFGELKALIEHLIELD